MSIYTYQEKLWLYEAMKTQTLDDAYYIFRVLRKNSEVFTENTNGVFFDLDGLKDTTIQELMMYYRSLKRLIEPPYYEEA